MKMSFARCTVALLMVTFLTLNTTGCAGLYTSTVMENNMMSADTTVEEKESVALTLWAAEQDQPLFQQLAKEFADSYADEATLTITLGVQPEDALSGAVLSEPEAAADVFVFTEDQLDQLVAADALQPVTDEEGNQRVAAVSSANVAGSVAAATANGQLYAFPLSADNGTILLYDSSVLSDEDVATMEGLLTAADAAEKTVGMDLVNGWYLYDFFSETGLALSCKEDGVTNICNWNAADTDPAGVEVAQAIQGLLQHTSFQSLKDDEMVSGIKDGRIAAAISGTWNAEVAKEAWGDNYAACKLPTYLVSGTQIQLGSFAEYELVGVNAHSQSADWAMRFAQYISNEKNQVERFAQRKIGPANLAAAACQEIQADPAFAAQAAQAKCACAPRVGVNYWSAAETFGGRLVADSAGGLNLQAALDELVTETEAPVV